MSDGATSLSVGTFGWGTSFSADDFTANIGVFGWAGAETGVIVVDNTNVIFFGTNF